jgi:hypothetical protein
MARGRPTPEVKREQVRALICLNPDVSEPEIARTVGIGKSTAHYLKKDIIENDIGKDDYESLREQKKQEFIAEAWEVVGKALKLTNKRFTKALDDEEAIEHLIDAVQDHELTQAEKKTLVSRLNGLQMNNIRDIAVALGTIYDKQALASGEPTQISESRKPLPDLVKDTEVMLQEIKQLTGT